MLECLAEIITIIFTTRKFANDTRVPATGHSIFELEKTESTCDDLRITLILQKGRFLLILFF